MDDAITPARPDIAIVIRPSLKRACCEGDACRAALLNQLLYCIAWKFKNGHGHWYGSYKYICSTLLDDCWGQSKVIKEINTLVTQGFIEQRHNPNNGWDQTKQYLFGEEQAKKFTEACEKAGVCILHQIGFPDDVLHLLFSTNAVGKNNKCSCQIQQIDLVNSTDRSVKSNNAIPKRTPKTSKTKISSKKEVDPPSSDQNETLNPSNTLEENEDSHLSPEKKPIGTPYLMMRINKFLREIGRYSERDTVAQQLQQVYMGCQINDPETFYAKIDSAINRAKMTGSEDQQVEYFFYFLSRTLNAS